MDAAGAAIPMASLPALPHLAHIEVVAAARLDREQAHDGGPLRPMGPDAPSVGLVSDDVRYLVGDYLAQETFRLL